MEEYMTVKEIAEKWGITTRRITVLCNEERLEGAVKKAGVWLIPADCKKPTDLRAYNNKKKGLD